MSNLRETHTLFLPRIVFMLPFEDLLHLGVVSPFLKSLDQSCLPLEAASG